MNKSCEKLKQQIKNKSKMSLPVDKLFCDYVVNKIIGHLEVKKTKSELIDELFTPTTAGKTLECSFRIECCSCPCGNELLFQDQENHTWNYCDRHDGYVCSDCDELFCSEKSCYGICSYCLNYDCKVMTHFKETHPDFCIVCSRMEDGYKHIYNPKETKCKDCYEYFDSYNCKVEGCDWTSQS